MAIYFVTDSTVENTCVTVDTAVEVNTVVCAFWSPGDGLIPSNRLRPSTSGFWVVVVVTDDKSNCNSSLLSTSFC